MQWQAWNPPALRARPPACDLLVVSPHGLSLHVSSCWRGSGRLVSAVPRHTPFKMVCYVWRTGDLPTFHCCHPQHCTFPHQPYDIAAITFSSSGALRNAPFYSCIASVASSESPSPEVVSVVVLSCIFWIASMTTNGGRGAGSGLRPYPVSSMNAWNAIRVIIWISCHISKSHFAAVELPGASL